MTYNTKRDGYYRAPVNSNPLGRPVPHLEPSAGHTHAIIIPGTAYKAFLTLDDSGEIAYKGPFNTAPVKMTQLMAGLKRSTIAGPGKRRVKASPVLMTITEFSALHTEVKAA